MASRPTPKFEQRTGHSFSIYVSLAEVTGATDTAISIGSVVNAVKDALPEEATMDQALKIARIVYHLGLGTGGAAFLWHEFFGK